MHQNAFAAEALPWTPLGGAYSALSDPLAGFVGKEWAMEGMDGKLEGKEEGGRGRKQKGGGQPRTKFLATAL